MQHKSCFEVVNWTLNEIYYISDSSLLNGIPTVPGRDLAKILSVVW